ncbi:MAG: enoyl-CoA hydratase/isomerase family protein [Novosphingobium sp.]
MTLDDTIVAPDRLMAGHMLHELPCLFVESCRDSGAVALEDLPAMPCIAIGESHTGSMSAFDMVVADREEAQRLFDRLCAFPHTARVIVSLLRMIPRLDTAAALEAESLAYGVLQAGDEFRRWLASRPAPARHEPGEIRAERRGDDLFVQMDRPWADNAIDRPMRDGLREMFELAVIDESIDRIVLTGAGRSFSLGADLAEFGTTTDPAEAHAIRQQTLPARWAYLCADRFEVHVQGACVGAGLELAAFAHRITASPRAWFQLPELTMGLLPGAGGCVSLSQRIGRQRTTELILTGRRLSARTALDWGLVDEIASDHGCANE